MQHIEKCNLFSILEVLEVKNSVAFAVTFALELSHQWLHGFLDFALDVALVDFGKSSKSPKGNWSQTVGRLFLCLESVSLQLLVVSLENIVNVFKILQALVELSLIVALPLFLLSFLLLLAGTSEERLDDLLHADGGLKYVIAIFSHGNC